MASITPLAPPTIVAGPDLSRVTDEAIAAVVRAPELYRRGTELVEVIEDEPVTQGITRNGGVARIHRVNEDRILELLAREAIWLGPDGSGGQRRVQPSRSIARMVLSRGRWPGIRPITGVSTAPTLRPDGSILSADGYDEATAIYLRSSVRVQVPTQPTREDAGRSLERLLDVICDFPATPAAKAAWVATVLSLTARPAIDGSVPMLIVDATTRGAGKTLLVDLAAVIATGRRAARMIYSRDDAEVRKMITACAIIADPMIALDNVVGEIGCAALDAALTGDTWRDRVLGSSTMTSELPMRIVFSATGNGIVIAADLVRRSLLVRLEPTVEHPEDRTGFRHPRVLDFAREQRSELLSAALTMLRAYHVAGRPDQRLTPMGSYESWSDLVRSALVWAGAADPCATIADLRADDTRTDALRGVMAAWPVSDGEPVTTARLLELATAQSDWRAALLEWVPPRGGELPTSRAVGYALRTVRGRVVGGQRIASHPGRAGSVRWSIARTGGDGGDAGPARTGEGGGDGGYGGDAPISYAADPFGGVGIETSQPSPPSPPGREPGEDDR